MSRSDSVLHTADLRQIGSQQREKLTDFVVKLSADSGVFTTPWHGFSDAQLALLPVFAEVPPF